MHWLSLQLSELFLNHLKLNFKYVEILPLSNTVNVKSNVVKSKSFTNRRAKIFERYCTRDWQCLGQNRGEFHQSCVARKYSNTRLRRILEKNRRKMRRTLEKLVAETLEVFREKHLFREMFLMDLSRLPVFAGGSSNGSVLGRHTHTFNDCPLFLSFFYLFWDRKLLDLQILHRKEQEKIQFFKFLTKNRYILYFEVYHLLL